MYEFLMTQRTIQETIPLINIEISTTIVKHTQNISLCNDSYYS